MKKLTIKRSGWGRRRLGDPLPIPGIAFGLLLNRKGKMCCLGFYCRYVSKIGKAKLLNVTLPNQIESKPIKTFLINISENSSQNLQDYLSSINDRSLPQYYDISNKEQERLIAEGFKLVDTEVTFVD